jgi:excisionase family DNA binding protein
MTTTNKLMLRTPDAAEVLGLSTHTLEKFRVTGGGPRFYKYGHKTVRYDRDDLEAWAKARPMFSTKWASP